LLICSFDVNAYDPYEEYRDIDCAKIYQIIEVLEGSLELIDNDSPVFFKVKDKIRVLKELRKYICTEV